VKKVFAGGVFLFIAISGHLAYSQKQLVVLNREKVLLRLTFGDEIIYRLKGSKTVRTSYVNNLYDTALMAHETIIPFHKIDKIYFKQSTFGNRIGMWLVIGGVGYFLIDQFNTVIVHGEDATIDEGVAKASGVMVGVGLPLMLIRKRSQRIEGRYRLLTVDEDSPFYQPNLDRMESPVIKEN